jgi:hypothetical protein
VRRVASPFAGGRYVRSGKERTIRPTQVGLAGPARGLPGRSGRLRPYHRIDRSCRDEQQPRGQRDWSIGACDLDYRGARWYRYHLADRPGHGHNTTNYGFPPTGPGLGYAFSGGASNAQDAKVVTCNGQPENFVLQPGGTADIQFLSASGAPMSSSPAGTIPVDNLYLPGLGKYAALETAPLSSSGQQIVSQLAPGVLQLSWTMSSFDCSGSGLAPGTGVVITSGHTSFITCRPA